MTQYYRKLVRDKIPQQIEANGDKLAMTRTLDNDTVYLRALLDKLSEEVQEVNDAVTQDEMLEELADLEEVIYAILDQVDGYERFTEARERKERDLGGFAGRVYLVRVDDKEGE